MTLELLATKLRIPPPSPHQISRNRLVDALERGISHYELILVSAPAGYGKTTLLSQWANATPCRVAWLSLSVEDSDPQRFLRYLLAAWERVQPEVRQSKLGLLLGTQAPDTGAVLTAFINVANTLSEPLVFVLDDYHMIADAAVHKALTFLLDNLPPTTHFVLTVRQSPHCPWRSIERVTHCSKFVPKIRSFRATKQPTS